MDDKHYLVQKKESACRMMRHYEQQKKVILGELQDITKTETQFQLNRMQRYILDKEKYDLQNEYTRTLQKFQSSHEECLVFQQLIVSLSSQQENKIPCEEKGMK